MKFSTPACFSTYTLKPRRKLGPKEEELKKRAKNIIKRVDSGEEQVLTTVIHASEIVNMVES